MQEEKQHDQPGQVIGPSVSSPETAPAPVQPPAPIPSPIPATASPQAPQPVAAPIPQPVIKQPPSPLEQNSSQQEIPTETSFYKGDNEEFPQASAFTDAAGNQNVSMPHPEGVSWTASEYIANAKTAGWFGLLAVATVLVVALIYFVTKSILSATVIGICGVLVGIFAARQPRVLTYRIDQQGLQIGEKFYGYNVFKSFSVVAEHALTYVSLVPLKRFMPPLIIHYSPEDESRIVGTLADYLPYEDHKTDVIDNLTRRVRF